jgi:hypothetical protein
MKLKLDLHPIYNDSDRIEEALQGILQEAVTKRASEVEIIPGKGSGALKKSVLRFLNRPDIKALYHRVEKDGDNWGRLFVHYRHERPDPSAKPKPAPDAAVLSTVCGACGDPIFVPEPEDDAGVLVGVACPWCGSPHRVAYRRGQRGGWRITAELDYGEFSSGSVGET